VTTDLAQQKEQAKHHLGGESFSCRAIASWEVRNARTVLTRETKKRKGTMKEERKIIDSRIGSVLERKMSPARYIK